VAGRAGAAEAVRIADETGQASTLAFALSCLSRFDAAQGRAEECVAHARRAQAIGDARFGSVVAFALAALGLLELGLGRPGEAAEHLELLGRRVAERGLREPGVVQWQPDLVEAHVRADHEADALRALEDLERAARESDRTWALAAAARCRGLLAADDEFEQEFERALELHSATPTPFERARSELCLGERRRRVVGAHVELLNAKGIAMVNVPNRLSPLYRAWMGLAKRRGTWTLGTEVPFSARELRSLARQAGGRPLSPVYISGLGTLVGHGVNPLLRRLGRSEVRVPQTQIPVLDLLAYDLLVPIVRPRSVDVAR